MVVEIGIGNNANLSLKIGVFIQGFDDNSVVIHYIGFMLIQETVSLINQIILEIIMLSSTTTM